MQIADRHMPPIERAISNQAKLELLQGINLSIKYLIQIPANIVKTGVNHLTVPHIIER